MDRINLETTDTPEIHIISVDGSLRIKGWDHNELRADSDESDTLSIKSLDNNVKVECKSGCMIRIPVEGSIRIDQVKQELMLKSIDCPIDVGQVYGQFMAKSVGSLTVKKAHSNLVAKNVDGSFFSELITGNVNLQDVEGPIDIKKINGNLVIKGYTSGITAEANGNATLNLDSEAGGSYNIRVNGNISCRLTPDTNAKIKLISGAKQINLKISGSTELHQINEYEFTVGDGEGQFELNAGGTIDLTIPVQEEIDWAYEFDLGDDLSSMADDISQIVSDQIESQLESLSENLNNLSNNLSNLGPFTSEKNREKLEAKRLKLKRKLARVERHATDKARVVSRRAAATARRIDKYKPSSEPIKDVERQKILEMLQNKHISVQEAEMLLAALEGKNPEYEGSDTIASDDPA